jgi:hypothetical protein
MAYRFDRIPVFLRNTEFFSFGDFLMRASKIPAIAAFAFAQLAAMSMATAADLPARAYTKAPPPIVEPLWS